MTPNPRPKIWLAVLAAGVLAVGVLAASVEAKPGDSGSGSPQDHKQAAQDRREAMKEAAKDRKEERKELRDDIKEACKEAKDNSTANATLEQRCAHLKDAVKARRVAHALLTAIRVHERELGRVTFAIHEVQAKLQNGTLNATARQALETRLGHLQDRQQKLIEKIADEKAKLQKLHDKWSEVADHLRDRKEKGEDDGGVDDDGAETSTSTSSSTTTAAA